MALQKFILEIVSGRRSSPVIRGLLTTLSLPWRLISHVRNWAYDCKLLRSYRAPIPTFSIGNIAVGGTGKTPLVQLLADALKDRGKVAVLSRGYRSAFEKSKRPIQISEGKGPVFAVAECGDEPYFLAQQTSAAIWVGANRTFSAKEAYVSGAQCLILDDGMQHRKLARDREIVTVDGNNPLCGGKFLPAGLLRDLPQRLKHAHLIVANHVRDLEHYEEIKKQLARYTSAPVVAMQHAVVEPALFAQRKVGAFCGIGNPENFYATLNQIDANLVGMLSLLDHQPIREEELLAFAIHCQAMGAEQLVCTEKDWVKLPSKLNLPLTIIPVQVRLQILLGKEHWLAEVEKMKEMMRK